MTESKTTTLLCVMVSQRPFLSLTDVYQNRTTTTTQLVNIGTLKLTVCPSALFLDTTTPFIFIAANNNSTK
jgi:hypothetical protein